MVLQKKARTTDVGKDSMSKGLWHVPCDVHVGLRTCANYFGRTSYSQSHTS